MKSAMRSRLAILLLFLAACSTTVGNIDDAAEWAKAAATTTTTERTDRSIVFGRARWIENGEEKEIGNNYFKMGLRPDLVRMEGKQRIQASVDKGGHFVWSLEPGTYLMHHDDRLPKSIETTTGFLAAAHVLMSIGIYNLGGY